LTSIVFASGAFDHGTSAGKGKWCLSLTMNPLNYFKNGQSYAVLGYGISEKIDITSYYSSIHNGTDNYYTGISYQFYKSKRLDLSTGIGFRKYTSNQDLHFFLPQLLYTFYFNDKIKLGGSFISIQNTSPKKQLGSTIDIFLITELFNYERYRIDFTLGIFKPALWTPERGDWHPTYSIDISLK
tara:strand:+ start:168 stop:719 length:552 start_codon:yes stop_codon:yes gene_type:complete